MRATLARLTAVRSLWMSCVASLLMLSACRTSPVEARDSGDRLAIERTLDELYRAFCFDPHGEADWEAMAALFIDGAAFVAPFVEGQTPHAVGADVFLADFKRYVASDAVRDSGLHERILHVRLDVFGQVAHAFVAFEGFAPGDGETRSRGLDSIQLLRDRGRWRVASFTTQYAAQDAPLPLRFVSGR